MTLCVRGLATLVSLFVAFALEPGVLSQTTRSSEVRIPMIRLESVKLETAIEVLARQAELNYILNSEIPNRAITRLWKEMSAKTALTNLLAEHKLFLLENPVTTVAHISDVNRIDLRADAQWITADTNGILPLIQFRMVPLDVALTRLARDAKVKIAINPELSGASPLPRQKPLADQVVSVRWTNLKRLQAMAALCENYGLVMVKDTATGAVRISPK